MLFILGLDGATLDLVEPWVADGTLPNLGRLIRAGAWGRLASTVPPATFPSWTSFMTGVNPGRHAIFDFTRRVPDAYRVHFINGTYRKAPTIWRLLSDAGCRVCVLGVPGTYPPEAVNGCMVSGFDTPVTLRADRRFVYPPVFAEELERLGGFPFADFQEFDTGPGWHARALAAMLTGIERKAELAERLLARESWDCFMLLMGESDTAAHHFWSLHDPASPRFRPDEAAALGDGIRIVYEKLDALLGRLQRHLSSAGVLVVSDHGFGGAGDTAIYLNRWLAREGYLTWQAGTTSARAMSALRGAAVRMIPERWQASCFRFAGGRVAGAVETRVRFGGIDWEGTRAFSEELNYFPAIWLNVQGRDPHGRVAGREYDQVCAELVARLLHWRDPILRQPVVRQVWRRDELYHGPYVRCAPDLILDLNTPGGYSYVCLPSVGQSGPVLERLDRAELGGGKLRGMSGSHRADGLFMLSGPQIATGEVRGAAIWDLAPTILCLCGVPVPPDWDGRVLPCVTGSADRAGALADEIDSAERPYDAREEACLKDHLVRLGYLE